MTANQHTPALYTAAEAAEILAAALRKRRHLVPEQEPEP
jgi:hypothetical protein